MWYVKAPGRVTRLSPSGIFYQSFDDTDWGRIIQYREVADDQFAVRQVDVYENGNVLRYDRSHRSDEAVNGEHESERTEQCSSGAFGSGCGS